MKNENFWLIWIPLIILVIMLFPKSCGFKNPSTDVDYRCSGFKTPFLSQIENSDNPQQWCSGICFSKSITPPPKNKTPGPDDQTPFSGMTDSFGKVVPSLFGILLIVGLLRWIGTFQKK